MRMYGLVPALLLSLALTTACIAQQDGQSPKQGTTQSKNDSKSVKSRANADKAHQKALNEDRKAKKPDSTQDKAYAAAYATGSVKPQ